MYEEGVSVEDEEGVCVFINKEGIWVVEEA
jgi:hypothetical protein